MSDSKIALITARLAHDRQAQANVIDLIEDMLAKAKTGEIQAFAACMVNQDGFVSTCYAKGKLPHNHHLTAGGVYLLHRLEREADG